MYLTRILLFLCFPLMAQDSSIIISNCTSTTAQIRMSDAGSGGGFAIQTKTNLDEVEWHHLGPYQSYPDFVEYTFEEGDARFFRAEDLINTIIAPHTPTWLPFTLWLGEGVVGWAK